jgi:dihydrofolate reductase
MRKVYVFMMLSTDGYFEGPNHDLSWHNVDDEFNKFAVELLREADLFLYGRRMYQLMESFWPKMAGNPRMSNENKEITRLINNTSKIVFSRTLKNVKEGENWRNVKLANKFDPAEIKRLKRQKGKNIWVGGSNLAVSFIKAGLVDEIMFMINPVVIGRGTPIFSGLGKKAYFKLLGTQTFRSGNVLLRYKPIK